MKQGKQTKALLPYQTILQASRGNPVAIETVIGYYRPYMATLAKRESVDGEGNIDMEMMRHLEAKLTAKVLLFRAE